MGTKLTLMSGLGQSVYVSRGVKGRCTHAWCASRRAAQELLFEDRHSKPADGTLAFDHTTEEHCTRHTCCVVGANLHPRYAGHNGVLYQDRNKFKSEIFQKRQNTSSDVDVVKSTC